MNTKNLNMFLMDGTAMGPIKSTISTWSGVIYKVPRNILSSELIQTRQHFKHSGIYFLIGYKDNIPSVYVGQAGNRKTGEAILSRIIEHTKNPSMNFFTEVLILTTENNNFGPTELNYLEHTFNTKINQIGSYQSININNPNMGNVTEEKESETARFYHILAEEQSQTEMLAVKEYANEFHISQNYVDVVSSNL